jgi:hypothetical protein
MSSPQKKPFHIKVLEQIVERALKALEANIAPAMRGEHGWTPKDAAELRRIATGLRYFLKRDYADVGEVSSAHETTDWGDGAPGRMRR